MLKRIPQNILAEFYPRAAATAAAMNAGAKSSSAEQNAKFFFNVFFKFLFNYKERVAFGIHLLYYIKQNIKCGVFNSFYLFIFV